MTSNLITPILIMLAVLLQGCQALPIDIVKTTSPTTVIGAALGIGLVLLIPTLAWVGIIIRRYIRRWRFNQK